jgi:hypothetical protein
MCLDDPFREKSARFRGEGCMCEKIGKPIYVCNRD